MDTGSSISIGCCNARRATMYVHIHVHMQACTCMNLQHDTILLSNIGKVESGLSDHDLIYGMLDIQVEKQSQTCRTIRCVRHVTGIGCWRICALALGV